MIIKKICKNKMCDNVTTEHYNNFYHNPVIKTCERCQEKVKHVLGYNISVLLYVLRCVNCHNKFLDNKITKRKERKAIDGFYNSLEFIIP